MYGQARFHGGEGYPLGASGQAMAKTHIRTTMAMLTTASTLEAAWPPRESASDPLCITRVDHTSIATQTAKLTTANPMPTVLYVAATRPIASVATVWAGTLTRG